MPIFGSMRSNVPRITTGMLPALTFAVTNCSRMLSAFWTKTVKLFMTLTYEAEQVNHAGPGTASWEIRMAQCVGVDSLRRL